MLLIYIYIFGEEIIDSASLGTPFVILLFFVKGFGMFVLIVQIINLDKCVENNNFALLISTLIN